MARKALGPATLEIVQAVRTQAVRPMVAAVSGGADSLALAYAVAHVCRERDLPYAAVTVDHGLQPGSGQRARTVADRLGTMGFADVVVRAVEVTPADGRQATGPEGDARTARYAVLDAEAAARDADLLLGHTLDDQAETVLLGLLRGSGSRSLAGMAVRSGRRLRPMLGIRRDRTRTACEELGLEIWDDPHNADPRFTRSRIRQRVLPLLATELGPGIPEALARTADLARADADLLDQLAADLYAEARSPLSLKERPLSLNERPLSLKERPLSLSKGGEFEPTEPEPTEPEPTEPDQAESDQPDLSCEILARADPALRTRVIKRWLTDRGAAEAPYNHVRAVEALIVDWHGQQEVHLRGVSVRRSAGALTIVGKPEP